MAGFAVPAQPAVTRPTPAACAGLITGASAALCLLSCVAGAAADPTRAAAESAPAPIPVEALFRDPIFDFTRISPDGEYFAMIHSHAGVQYLAVRRVEGGTITPILRASDPDFRMRQLNWANDDTLLISTEMRWPWCVGMRPRSTRLYAIKRDGQQFRYMARKWPHGDAMQFQDNILHVPADDPEHVLIQYRPPGHRFPITAWMRLSTGALSRRDGEIPYVYDWFADSQGQVRAGAGFIEREDALTLYARAGAGDQFVSIGTFPTSEPTRRFAGFSEDPTKVFLLSDEELGRDALYEYDVVAQRVLDRVYAHEWADVESLVYEPGTDHLIAISYAVDDWERYWLDEQAQNEQHALDAALPQMQPRIVDQSRNRQHVIVRTASDVAPPRFWLYDRATRHIDPLSESYPELEGKSFAPMEAVRFHSRDGIELHGYLTRPLDAAHGALPLIVLVHDGPRTRDVRGWNPEVQLFASRGFAVLQVNFRGSTGYGRSFLELGDRQWGLAMQDDLEDAVRSLIAQGIADADRVGIYGAGYGGYAAVMALVKTPDLYRCGASYAGIMNLTAMLREEDAYVGGRMVRRWIGDPFKDARRLMATSPLENVARIKVPVLLAHGEDDPYVNVRQTKYMGRMLLKADKEVELMVFPDETHEFKEERNRIEFYTRLVAFFERNLAVRAQTSSPVAGGSQ